MLTPDPTRPLQWRPEPDFAREYDRNSTVLLCGNLASWNDAEQSAQPESHRGHDVAEATGDEPANGKEYDVKTVDYIYM